MVFLIRYYCDKYFRWMDSGDVQGANHLKNIVRVATETPQVSHWLPTRESKMVRTVLSEIGEFPENLVVRVSAPMIDGKPPRGFPHTSTVVSDPEESSCPSHLQGGGCEECRDCWNPATKNVGYLLH